MGSCTLRYGVGSLTGHRDKGDPMWRTGCVSHRVASAVMLAAFSLGCTTWKTERLAPEQVITSKRPDHVRVLQASGARLELWAPRLSNDSLIGRLERGDSARLGAIALAEVRELQVRGVSAGKTVLLAAGVGVAVLLVAAAASSDGYFKDGGGSDTTSSQKESRRPDSSGASSGACVVRSVTRCWRESSCRMLNVRMRPPVFRGHSAPSFTQRMRTGQATRALTGRPYITQAPPSSRTFGSDSSA